MMKIVENGGSTIDYPVGENMSSNKHKIYEMINSFMQIDEFKDKYVNIICQGSSGAIIATMFSISIRNLNKIIHIKKNGENSHSSAPFLEKGSNCINIIVDDFICSGETIKTIYDHFNVPIDCLCVSGHFRHLTFFPKYYICNYTTVGDIEDAFDKEKLHLLKQELNNNLAITIK